MSSPIINTLKNTVAVASAALFIQIGSAAAAGARADFQQQVRQVLTGALVSPPAARPNSGRRDPLARSVDAQAFVQRLLLGVSLRYPMAADPMERSQPQDALRVASSTTADEDAQAAVRRVLLGQHVAMRGAL